eukprot:351290-Chlamydomonas_euryale.AAC.6
MSESPYQAPRPSRHRCRKRDPSHGRRATVAERATRPRPRPGPSAPHPQPGWECAIALADEVPLPCQTIHANSAYVVCLRGMVVCRLWKVLESIERVWVPRARASPHRIGRCPQLRFLGYVRTPTCVRTSKNAPPRGIITAPALSPARADSALRPTARPHAAPPGALTPQNSPLSADVHEAEHRQRTRPDPKPVREGVQAAEGAFLSFRVGAGKQRRQRPRCLPTARRLGRSVQLAAWRRSSSRSRRLSLHLSACACAMYTEE